MPLPLGWKALINALAILLLDLLLCRYKHRQGILPAYLLASCGVLVLSVLLLTLASVFWSGVTTAILLFLAGSVRFVSRQSKLLLQANTDGLTGLYNRRHFDEILAPTLDKHRAAGKTLALLILDVDNFKGYNDHYGHYAGDLILQRLAQELNAYFSPRRHIVARLGGEEFGVLLEECGQDQAVAAAEGFRARLEELELPHLKSPLRKVTCSIGVAARVPETDDNGRTFYEDADSALYIAKRSGRNAVSPAPDTLTPQH
ncbi:GGDEF domain-containing protein [Chromobacterium haemolyticum]|nr:GGDEF domain-containing protein [Chromobacterium haemolyticum]